MTVGFVPAFESKLGERFEGDGAALFHHAAVLDALAEERGLSTLTSFADNREPPPDFDGFPEELVEAIGPFTAWFSSRDGLRCVEGLLDALAEPKTKSAVPFADALIDDLTALRDVLVVAVKRKTRFRLEVA